MTWERTYTDEELTAAVAISRSWRGVLRELGLVATSAKAIRSVRNNADRVGADYSHFRGWRSWTDEQLRQAVKESEDWPGVAKRLELEGPSAVVALKGHTARLGIDTKHLVVAVADSEVDTEVYGAPRLAHLRRSGSLLAAAWFTMCGHEVSWPLEPARYDLLVRVAAEVRRVQVKTTMTQAGKGWRVFLSTSGRQRRPYDLNEIDEFFIVDGDLNYYLIPAEVVGGLHMIHLAAYEKYSVSRIFEEVS